MHGMVLVCAVLAVSCLSAVQAVAQEPITSSDIIPTVMDETSRGGLGQLDLILLSYPQGIGVNNNVEGIFNGDDANTDIPLAVLASTAQETYMTSIGDLRDFYGVNFPDGSGGSTAQQIVLFLNLNQTDDNGITLNELLIIADYSQIYGDLRDTPNAGDIPSELQNATNTNFSNGTVLADLVEPMVLPLNLQGEGFADYMILTGINPFDPSFTDDTRILFFADMSGLDNGAEVLFISGEFIPEPASLIMLALGGLAMLGRRKG